MKRYIRASEDIDNYLQQVIDEFNKRGFVVEQSGEDELSRLYGFEVISVDGSSEHVRDGYPRVGDIEGFCNRFWLQDDGYDRSHIVENVTKYCNHFRDAIDNLSLISTRLPQLQNSIKQYQDRIDAKYGDNVTTRIYVAWSDDTDYPSEALRSDRGNRIMFHDVFGEARDDLPYVGVYVKVGSSDFNHGYPYSSWMSGEAQADIEKQIQAKIKRASGRSNTMSSILSYLSSKGIDTTSQSYELCAQVYERYTDGGVYTKRFRCNGDYLAYFSMLFHEAPTFKKLMEYFGMDDLEDFIDENPTVDAIRDYANSTWWGDGSDLIIYLDNVSNGTTLSEIDNADEYR